MAARLPELTAAELTAAPVIRRRRGLPASLVVGGTIVLALVVIAALAQWIAPYPYDQMHVRDRFSPPNLHYLRPFGVPLRAGNDRARALRRRSPYSK